MPAQVSPGTVVSPRGYLGIVDASIQALGGFTQALESVPTEPTPAQLRSVAPSLDLALGDLRQADRRLAAIRVSDRRIESQRAAASRAYDAALRAMEDVHAAAAAGDQALYRTATVSAARTLGELRAVGDRSGSTQGATQTG